MLGKYSSSLGLIKNEWGKNEAQGQINNDDGFFVLGFKKKFDVYLQYFFFFVFLVAIIYKL